MPFDRARFTEIMLAGTMGVTDSTLTIEFDEPNDPRELLTMLLDLMDEPNRDQ